MIVRELVAEFILKTKRKMMDLKRFNTMVYTKPEIVRIGKTAFELS